MSGSRPAAGLATTVLYVFLSTLPIVSVVSRFAFAAKIGGLVLGANIIGVFLYSSARRSRDRNALGRVAAD